MYFVFEALKQHNYGKEVVNCVNSWWNEFIQLGYSTVPEVFPEAMNSFRSCCHAWSAHSLVQYRELRLGIRACADDSRSFCFNPVIDPKADIFGEVPTKHGLIAVKITRGKCSIRLPKQKWRAILPGEKFNITPKKKD